MYTLRCSYRVTQDTIPQAILGNSTIKYNKIKFDVINYTCMVSSSNDHRSCFLLGRKRISGRILHIDSDVFRNAPNQKLPRRQGTYPRASENMSTRIVSKVFDDRSCTTCSRRCENTAFGFHGSTSLHGDVSYQI